MSPSARPGADRLTPGEYVAPSASGSQGDKFGAAAERRAYTDRSGQRSQRRRTDEECIWQSDAVRAHHAGEHREGRVEGVRAKQHPSEHYRRIGDEDSGDPPRPPAGAHDSKPLAHRLERFVHDEVQTVEQAPEREGPRGAVQRPPRNIITIRLANRRGVPCRFPPSGI